MSEALTLASPESLVGLASLAVLALASIAAAHHDYRSRRIPNAIPWLALAFSLAFAFFLGAPPFYYALVLVSFAFALALYFGGAWAGGDAKFFTACLALAGLARFPTQIAETLLLPAGVFLLAAALTAPFALFARRERAWRERRVLGGAFVASVKDAVGGALLAGLVHALGVIVFSWSLDGIVSSLAAGAAGVFAASFVLRAAFFAAGLLKEKIPLQRVREGVVSAQTLYLDAGGALRSWGWRDSLRSAMRGGDGGGLRFMPHGRVLCDSKRAAGLSAAEARELKKVLKSRGVGFLLARDALPFAPQVGAAAFALALLRLASMV
ncbi:MAG: prepilin peptidase [Candidatus Micrarchaeota archaeon]